MPINCILPGQAEKLKTAFKTGELSMTKLFSISSSDRVKLLEPFIGDSAKMAVAKLEKSYLSPNQKLAMRNWLFKNVAQAKPLYKGITLDQSEEMAKNLNIKDLQKMTDEQRIAELSKYIDNAESLNKRFNTLKKTGNLANWEERTLGTEKLRKNKQLKGSLARLETLDDLGVLNPDQIENFMQTFVEDKLGVNITFEQSQKLSELVKTQKDAFDKLEESGDWTNENYQQNLDFRIAVNELTKFTENLKDEKSAVELGNDLVEISRNNILGTIFSGINSALYQKIPTIERLITKRITPATLLQDASLRDRISAKIAKGLFADKEGRKFIANQLKMGMDIYDKTNVDISRMTTLNDGYVFFGERQRKGAVPITRFKDGIKDITARIKEAKTIRGKLFTGVGAYAELTGNFPKWMAGGTDTIIANTTRAETAVLWSSEIANLEGKQGKLPEGVSEKERAKQLLKDSYNPNSEDEQAQIIREQSILDAHFSNNTQPDSYADWVVKVRDALGMGKFKFGKGLVPFVKITATTISRGLQTATGIGVVKNLRGLQKAMQHPNKIEAVSGANKAISGLIGFVGLTATTLLIALFLDEDDYVPPYAVMSFKKYKFAEAQGARPNSIKLFGKWIPIRYLPMVSIPLASIMMARQAQEKGESVIMGYIAGILSAVIDTPVIREFAQLVEKGARAVTKTDLTKLTETTGTDMESIWDWSKIRIIPSIISRDLYNVVLPTTKYNFLGEEVEKGKIFRDDKSNAVIIEFNELDKTGKMPAILNPTTDYAKELESKIGKEEYERLLSEYQRNYANKVSELLNKGHYQRKSDENKKEAIDDIRSKEILEKLKKDNKDKL